MSRDLGISPKITPSQSGQIEHSPGVGKPPEGSPLHKLSVSGHGSSELPKSPPSGGPKPSIHQRDLVSLSSPGSGGSTRTFDEMPSRKVLEGLIKTHGDGVKVTVSGREYPAVGLSQFLQASGHLDAASKFSDAATPKRVGGDDRQVTVTNPLTGGKVDLDLRCATLFAFAIERLDPKAAEVVRAQVATVRSDAHGTQMVLREPSMGGDISFKSFGAEMFHSGAMKGENYDGSPISVREELQRGHGLFLQAMKTPSDVPLIFGRTPEVNSTNAGFFKYTSERMEGSVLMPEKWNLFLNSCWLMGGIKHDVAFAPLTVFQASDKAHDFRSSEQSDGPGGLPNRFIITVSVGEIEGLKACGYKQVDHEVFGSILVPGKDKESVERRQNVTMKEVNQIMYLMALAQASDNVTGGERVSTYQRSFLGQDKPSVTSKLEKTVDLVKSSGLSATHPDNPLVRKGETKVLLAYQRIDWAGPRFEGTIYIEKAWQEVTQGVLLIANHAIKELGVLAPEAEAIKTEIIRHLETERDKGRTEFGLRQEHVREFVASRMGKTDAMRVKAETLNENLSKLEDSFKGTLKTQRLPPSEHAALWAQFQGAAKRLDNPSPSDLNAAMKGFLLAHLQSDQSFLAMPRIAKL